MTDGKIKRLRRMRSAMIGRCTDYWNDAYVNYGGRGIAVCDEWLKSSKAFVEWCLANGYERNLEIDRIDNDGDYSPDNCRFVTHKVNCNNKRATLLYEYEGERLTIADLQKHSVVSSSVLRNRLRAGWDLEKALKTPLMRKGEWRKGR